VPAVALLAAFAPAADAGTILKSADTLLFLDNGSVPAYDVTVSSGDDGSILLASASDVITGNSSFPAPCSYTSPPAHDAISCDPTGIAFLVVGTGPGDDRVTMQRATPSLLCGGPGTDVITGGPAADRLFGAAGDDQLAGGDGGDIERGDFAPGQEGPTASTCSADPGSAPGADVIDGGAGDDLGVGDGGNDTVRGGPGDDVAFGLDGDDALLGEDGADLLVGNDGRDELAGGPATDVLSGGAGDDVLRGEDGDDDVELPVLFALDLGDPVQASLADGRDRLEGGAGDDRLFAGPGERTVNYGVDPPQRAGGRTEANGPDTIVGGPGVDEATYVNRELPVTVTLDGAANDGSAGEGDDVAQDVERVTGGERDDVLTGSGAADALAGGPGADTLAGGDGTDVLDGGPTDEGADRLAGGAGADELRGGPGPDALAGDDGPDHLLAGGGDDRLDGGAGDDALEGEADDDALAGGPGADVLDGGPGADLADYRASTAPVTVTLDGVRDDGEAGEDTLRDLEGALGGAGADTLVGDGGANRLEGGAGPDLLDGGGGADTLRGGTGRDALRARDGVRDDGGCGPDADLALVDGRDALRAGAERCERADQGTRPRRGEALLRPRGCALQLALPGFPRPLGVSEALSVPRRTRVDAGRCALDLRAGAKGSRVRASGARFTLRAVRRGALALALAGPRRAACRKRPRPAPLRLALAARGRGGTTLAAPYATVSARRASWTVEARCAATVTRVRRGRVVVQERGRKRAVVVRAGRRHVSRRRS
jgi:Ca2+-binding RTX toxin-like protein